VPGLRAAVSAGTGGKPCKPYKYPRKKFHRRAVPADEFAFTLALARVFAAGTRSATALPTSRNTATAPGAGAVPGDF
tara:strand:- start:102 stop:332 length:231 start_codon:yes stop_codon:yes gene_type:complete